MDLTDWVVQMYFLPAQAVKYYRIMFFPGLAVRIGRKRPLLVETVMYHQTMVLAALVVRVARRCPLLVETVMYHQTMVLAALVVRAAQTYPLLAETVMDHQITDLTGLSLVLQVYFLPAGHQFAALVTAALNSQRNYLLVVVSVCRRTGPHSVAAVRFAQKYFPSIEVASFVRRYFLRRREGL